MSPTPGRSTLMQSAPSQARSCVQVGPDCTWVKSRIFTPSSALPAAPHGNVEGLGMPFPFFLAPLRFAAVFFAGSLMTFFLAADFLAATFFFAAFALVFL